MSHAPLSQGHRLKADPLRISSTLLAFFRTVSLRLNSKLAIDSVHLDRSSKVGMGADVGVTVEFEVEAKFEVEAEVVEMSDIGRRGRPPKRFVLDLTLRSRRIRSSVESLFLPVSSRIAWL